MDDQDFWDVIQTQLKPTTVGRGPGWVVGKLMDGVYEVVCDGDESAQLRAAIFLRRKLKIDFSRVVVTDGYRLPDGRIAVTYLKKDKKVGPLRRGGRSLSIVLEWSLPVR